MTGTPASKFAMDVARHRGRDEVIVFTRMKLEAARCRGERSKGYGEIQSTVAAAAGAGGNDS